MIVTLGQTGKIGAAIDGILSVEQKVEESSELAQAVTKAVDDLIFYAETNTQRFYQEGMQGLERAEKLGGDADIIDRLKDVAQRTREAIHSLADQRQKAAAAFERLAQTAGEMIRTEREELKNEMMWGMEDEAILDRVGHIVKVSRISRGIEGLETGLLEAIAEGDAAMIDERLLAPLGDHREGIAAMRKEAYTRAGKQALAGMDEALGITRGALEAIREELRALAGYRDRLREEAGRAMEAARDERNAAVAAMDSRAVQSKGLLASIERMIIGVSVTAVVIGLLLGILLSRSITVPTRRLEQMLQRSGGGDLTVRAADYGLERRDEIGHLAGELGTVLGRVGGIIRRTQERVRDTVRRTGRVTESARSAAGAVERIQKAVESLAEQTENASASLQQTSAGVQEVSSSAENAAASAQEGNEYARTAEERAPAAAGVIAQAVERINEADRGSTGNRERLQSLWESVEQITGFVATVTNIADQTNLLALNAAIEAARAGEHGRGFAVVAEEVRKLAEQSGSAAGEISGLIERLEEEARHSMEATDTSRDVHAEAVRQAGEAQREMEETLEHIRQLEHIVAQSAELARSQASSGQEIAEAIQTVTSSNMEISRQVAEIKDLVGGAARSPDGGRGRSVRAGRGLPLLQRPSHHGRQGACRLL